MAYPKPFILLLLLLKLQLVTVVVNSLVPSEPPFTDHTTASPECLPDQASALLRLKRSFSNTNHSSVVFRSWEAGTDCCHWEGVRCRGATGRVSSLDLGDRGLESPNLDLSLFELSSLRYLNLAGNDFRMSKIPSTGFERFPKLTHLNLSATNFSGQVPRSIGRLTNVVSLDLSFRFEPSIGPFHVDGKFHADITRRGQLTLPNLTAILENMGSLRELHLGFVDLSNQGGEWCTALARYTPNLHVLSMPYCELTGPICGSIAGLQSLSVIDLQHNNLTGPFPDFFAEFSSLSVLQLGYNDLHGWVPPSIFQHKRLVTIDLHKIPGLSGTLPNFSDDSNLENLLIGNTNFSGAIPSSISNLKSLKKLGLGAQGFAGDLPSSISELKFLSSLQVSGLEVVGSIPPCITNLTSLEVLLFSLCGLHGPVPSSISQSSEATRVFGFIIERAYWNYSTGASIFGLPWDTKLVQQQAGGKNTRITSFQLFSNSSFMRNDGLCGPPLSKNCSNETTPYTTVHPWKENHADIVLFLFAGLGFGVGFAVAIIGTLGLPLRKRS